MKRISISRLFPAYHPRRHSPTNFVEKILNNIKIDYRSKNYILLLQELNPTKNKQLLTDFVLSLDFSIESEKHHTIRSGTRHKPNDLLCPYAWSNPRRPYTGHQIVFAPPIKVFWTPAVTTSTQTMDSTKPEALFLDGDEVMDLNSLAGNDGLSETDFIDWFELGKEKKKMRKGHFNGQAIVWDQVVNYR